MFAYNPFLAITSPLRFVGPVSSRHLALCYVLCMSRFERLVALSAVRRSRLALLTKPDRLYLTTRFRHHNMALGLMAGCALGLIVTRHTSTSETCIFLRHYFFFLRADVVIFLPLFLAAALAFFMPAAVYENFFFPTIGMSITSYATRCIVTITDGVAGRTGFVCASLCSSITSALCVDHINSK